MDVVINLIQTMGFPIAACVFLGYYIKTQNAQYREDVQNINAQYRQDVKEITEKYENAIKDFQDSLDKNTTVLTRLDARLVDNTNDIEA